MLRIGFATRDITPPRPAMIQGQMHTRIGRDARDPITLTAMAIEGGSPTDAAILVSCDIAFPPPQLYDTVRQRLAQRISDFPADKLVLNATHTHDSMVLEDGFYPHPGGDVMTPDECFEFLADKVTDAASDAWRSRKERIVGSAFGHAVVGHNRHAVYADGHAQMYGKTSDPTFQYIAGYEDHSVDMLFVWTPDGKLEGAVIAVPCPSQVEENLNQFSADFWHEVRLELHKHIHKDLFIVPLCSAAGDQSPHFLLYGKQEQQMRERRGASERQEIAERIRDAVMKALSCTKPNHNGDVPFSHTVKHADLTPRKVTKVERDWAQAERARFIERTKDSESWWPARLQRVVDLYEGRITDPPFPAELHMIRLGDVAIATNPFELFLDYGMQIKARSPAAQTILVQITGRGWYLPTQRAVDGGGYGAMPAVGMVGPEGGRELVELTVDTINSLFAVKK